MRKILITSLGSGNKDRKYNKTNYDIEGELYEDEMYVASALENHFKIEKTFYIGTFGSMWENIYNHYCEKYSKEKNQEYENEIFEKMIEFLESSIEEKGKYPINFIDFSEFKKTFDNRVIPIITNYGLNDTEIFENFNNILEIARQLEDGDKLYLDITHSFRSNAFWVFLVMNYVNDVIDKKIDVEFISYGIFEAKEKNKNGIEVTPVINLKLFFDIIKWIKVAYTLKNYGNSDLICSLIEDKNIKNKLNNLSNAVSINYISSIRESLNSLEKNYELITKIDGPGKLIIPDVISKFLNHFKGVNKDKDYEMFLKLAEWHYKEKRYAIAYTNVVEAFNSYAIYNGISKIESNKDKEEVKPALKALFSELFWNKKELKKEYSTLFDKKTAEKLKKFLKNYETCRKIRNNIAHSGDGRTNPQADINSLENILAFLGEIFKEEDFLKKCKEMIEL